MNHPAPIISVNKLTKKYRLYERPIDRLKEAIHPLRKIYHINFTALDEVSFEIADGQSVGIVGKNGSGKSTLLKLITGILTPSSGHISVHGRIAALLELGAGFNPEMTGIENIHLNGSIMGFSREEMTEKLNDILEFADIGDFAQQPVKTYSSGMFARLAFALAINVDPEILIVDETLSVGDIRFQQKCIRKMREFAQAGKTVIFVTHDVQLVTSFCSRAIWIDSGKIKDDGPANKVIKRYTSFMAYNLESKPSFKVPQAFNSNGWREIPSVESFGQGGAKLIAYKLDTDDDASELHPFSGGETITLSFKVQVSEKIDLPGLGIVFKDQYGNPIFGVGNYIYDIQFDPWHSGEHEVRINFKMPYLKNGDYFMSVAISDGTQLTHEQHDWIHDLVCIKISSNDIKQQLGNFIALKDGVSFFVEQVK